jgi:uncharacterized protein GlcG (DUF336 family)
MKSLNVYNHKMMCFAIALAAGLFVALSLTHGSVLAGEGIAGDNCKCFPTHAQLKAAIDYVRENMATGGFDLDMWATIVNRDAIVCAVAFTGSDRGDQWPGSRVISAQKANTANAFSLPGLAISTANLYSAVQPGGSLFGLQHSNPVNPGVAYGGNPKYYGTSYDPMTGKKIGGVNVFGGGLALYNSEGRLVGALGASGNTSCADHNFAWLVRERLDLHHVPDGIGNVNGVGGYFDNIIYDTKVHKSTGHTTSAGGFGHRDCGLGEKAIAEAFPSEHPIIPPSE